MKKLFKCMFWIFIICLAVVSPFINSGYTMYKEALEEIPIDEMVKEIQSKEYYIKLEDVPKIYLDAVIAVEDRRFYTHGGVDPVSIGRAIITDIQTMSLREGGSTITQQLCKNIYFTQERKLERKIAEVFMAIELEKELQKEEILELYINTSYFGSGCYTLREASLEYFEKEPLDLNESQCILLAGVPNAPAVYAPNANLELSLQRQKQVIAKMIDCGYLTEEEANKILEQEI
ncbi:MAG: transglycosylase domain-containing protein [Clostridia bacterium]|nr:transglycosylase domain-containing protein [Clostridia bacterium]